jgi:hypothetical protein
MTFFVLVLLLVKVDGSGIESRFGPFTYEQCKSAGEVWLQQHIGQGDISTATWDCRVMTWRK